MSGAKQPDIDPSSRGAQTGTRTSSKAGFAAALKGNKNNITPTQGAMSKERTERFLEVLVRDLEVLSDLAKADYEELLNQLIFMIVIFGGEVRAYEGSDAVYELKVGGKGRHIGLSDFAQTLSNFGATPRSITRANSKLVMAVLGTPDAKEYFSGVYGPDCNPKLIRADLVHGGYAHKFDSEKFDQARRAGVYGDVEERSVSN